MREGGANIRAVNKAGENVLHLLLATDTGGCTDELSRKTLSFFARECPEFINSRNSQGFTPLQLAAENGFEWAWEILCDAGADLYMISPDGKTALHNSFSISGNWFKWVKRLIGMGIDINARDGQGDTPIFDWARGARAIEDKNIGRDQWSSSEEEKIKEFRKTLMFFKEVGSNFHILNNRKENLLHVLASKDFSCSFFPETYDSNLVIFKMLVGYGLDPLAQNEKGWSALVRVFTS